MNVHAATSAVQRTPLGAKPNQLHQTKADHIAQASKAADQAPQPKGVEVMRREMAARKALAADQNQPPDRLLKRLADSVELDRSASKRAAAEMPSAPSKFQASQTSRPVALGDVQNALAKVGVDAVTETGAPMTQDWINKKLEALNVSGGGEPLSSQSHYEITIEGLMANWGKNDSIYDLTGDGTVDGGDLLMLLQNGGKMMVEIPHDTELDLTLEGLLAAWGKSDSPYDLTGNGTVNGEDLLLFLQMMGGDGDA